MLSRIVNIFIAVSFLTSCANLFTEKKASFEFYNINCNLFNRSGNLLRSNPEYFLCDYNQTGEVIASDPSTKKLSLFNYNNELIWTSNEYAHHDLQFADNGNSILVINSDKFNFEKDEVRTDCISKRNLENKILTRWCVKDHIADLINNGIVFKKTKIEGLPWTSTWGLKLNFEITHMNSVQVIPENLTANKNSAFTKGNYLIHLWDDKNSLIILDKEMKKILWSKQISQIYMNNISFDVKSSHRFTVTSDGNILGYFNEIQYSDLKQYNNFIDHFNFNQKGFWKQSDHSKMDKQSWLIKFNPESLESVWEYTQINENNFSYFALGDVYETKNGFIYSNNNQKNELIEIDQSNRQTWSSSDHLQSKSLVQVFIFHIFDHNYFKNLN